MFNFKNVKQLLSHFAEEKTCWDFLEYRLWRDEPVCPHCGSIKVYRIKETFQFKCGNKKTCDKKFNVLTGSSFENTKIPLSTWFAAIYLATSHKKVLAPASLRET